MLGLGIGLTQVAVLRAGGFSPAALFGNGEKGYVSDMAAMFQDVAGVVPASAAGQVVAFGCGATGGNAVQADAGKRPVYAVVPSTGRRNFAIGSAHVAEEAYWSTSKTVNGIVTTKIGHGIDADGFDYADFSVVGTASSTAAINLYTRTASRTPAAAGQSWTTSAIVSRIGGTAAPAQSGIRVEGIGELAPATILGSFNGATVDPATETVITVTAPLADPATNQVTGTVSARIQAGATINATYRVKALQVEQGTVRTGFQRVISAFDVTEAGVASLPYLYRDADDGLATTVPDLGANATVWYATKAAAVILTGQAIGAGAFETLRGDVNFVPAGVVDRALTSAEAAGLLAYLNAARGA